MSLKVDRISKRFGERTVVNNVSFRVDDGELVALLGPSGSGKSTVLRIVAGLTPCDAGRVEVDGSDVTVLPPQARDLGFVFQNYALFEHLSVADNIEFALRVRGVGKSGRARRRDELLEQVGLGGSARKYPGQLSGGQRQRTALARALAHRPRLLLLDEPFGALDAQIRQELRQGLRDLLKQLGTTAVFVTHDQEEAFSVADRILVLHRGRLLEQGPSEQLYQTPRSEFVARFVGRANVMPGQLTPDGVWVRTGDASHPQALPKRIKVLFRPERLQLLPLDTPATSADAVLLCREARVEHVEYLGGNERVEVAIGSEGGDDIQPLTLNAVRSVEDRGRLPLQRGDRVQVLGRQPHAITQPSLRLLVLAGETVDDIEALEQYLDFADSEHALLTVIGRAVGLPRLATRLERARQSFAGDLKLIDPRDLGIGVLDAARTHLASERYELLALSPSLQADPGWFSLMQLAGVGHVLLPGHGRMPLLPGCDNHWPLMLHRFSTSRPDLGLLGELARTAQAKVTPLAPDSTVARPHGPGLTDFLLRAARVPAQALGRRHAEPVNEQARRDAQAPGQLLVLDLGPRSLLGAPQQSWLQPFRERWTLLLIQSDESDFDLRQPMTVGTGAATHPA